jgi:nucleoside-diphosphate-sugar epimerase
VYRSRQVLVLGASGFIGRWVARALSAADAKLVLAARDAKRMAEVCSAYEIRGEILAADLLVAGAFAHLQNDARPDITFNLAGYGVDPTERDAALAEALNTSLAGEVARATAAQRSTDWRGLRLVHAGSAAEYGSVDGPVSENSPAAPHSLYGRTKLAGTREFLNAVQASGMRAVCARLFTVYGPGEHSGRLLPSLLDAARAKKALPLTAGEQQRDFTYVGEAAEGLLRLGCVESEMPAVVNLATGMLTSVRAFAECASELLRMEPGQLQFGVLPYRGDELRQGPVATRLLEQSTEWKPTLAVRDGIRETIAFESRRGGVIA